jgi:hypothetical protein
VVRHLAERAIPPLAQMPRELWMWDVDVEVADLSTCEKLAQSDFKSLAPTEMTGLNFKR